jgi:hypothetical protein
MKPRRLLLILAFVVSLAGTSVFGQLTAVTFNTLAFSGSNGGSGVFGWRFTTQSDLRVTDVGIFDASNTHGIGDGFAAPHTLAIWDVAAPDAPLSISLIPAGTETTLMNGFRYVPLDAPTYLLQGHSYVIGATYQLDDNTVSDHNPAPGLVVTIAPYITFDGYSFTNEPGLVFPDQLDVGNYASFGPNFIYTPVPEPSTLTFALVGGLLFLTHRWRVTRRQNRTPREANPS